MASSLQDELKDVRDKLDAVDEEIQQLLEHQAQLMDRRNVLESAIRQANKVSQVHLTKADFSWSAELQQKLAETFKIQTLRPLQLQTMNATLSGVDCVLVMPTGGGKSLCFQLPALLTKGITLVVSPLISLMEDQQMAMSSLNVPAAVLSGGCNRNQIKTIQDDMTNPNCPFKLLYVTPERLAKSKRFMAKLEKMYALKLFARIVIDEIHCCSQWGHDFRPDYKYLGVLRRMFPTVPILGLTATATAVVIEDVKKILGIDRCEVHRASVNRHNLYYEVLLKPSGLQGTVDALRQLIQKRFSGQSGIIYCLSQKDTEVVAAELRGTGIAASSYHAGMLAEVRSRVHQDWLKNKVQVVVATIAFGMGIDKCDVRFVVHHSISKSLENYYQESGRAGRDSERACCIVFAGFSDIFRQSTMLVAEQTGQEKLYGMLKYVYNTNSCRRVMISRHFGEKASDTKCHQMCDNCSQTDPGEMWDATEVARLVISCLRETIADADKRITANKLLGIISGSLSKKSSEGLKSIKKLSVRLSQWNFECLLVHMLLKGYLKEDFHFTPMSNISYIMPGPNQQMLLQDGHKFMLHLPKGKTTSKSPLSSAGSSSSARPVFINAEKSAFINGGVGNRHTPKLSVTKSEKNKVPKKKRILEIDSDSDLDFCEMDLSSKRKKAKGKGGPKKEKIPLDIDAEEDVVVLDSDDENAAGDDDACYQEEFNVIDSYN